MKKTFFKKTLIILIVVFIVIYAVLWSLSLKQYKVDFGVSFSPEYAESLGLDSKKVYEEILTDLKPKYIRLAVPWSRVEVDKGTYSFANVDYYMNEAEKHNVKILLAIGQKVPRWPECYIPEWIKTTPANEKSKEFLSYIETTVNRYKNHPALEYWQVENEPFIKFEFGECGVFDQTFVKGEVELVDSLDLKHKIVMTDSGELSTWQKASSMGDILGVTVYRVVRTRGGVVWNYGWIPASVYRLRANLWNRDYNNFFVSELQAEPWFSGGTPANTEINVQEQTSSLAQMQKNISFAKKVGASRAYFWGVEWWYWMKTTQNNPTYWEEGKKELAQ
ncbi:MAG: beta-galactosidase [bacterium]